jgi:hypothetical protein
MLGGQSGIIKLVVRDLFASGAECEAGVFRESWFGRSRQLIARSELKVQNKRDSDGFIGELRLQRIRVRGSAS